MDKLYSHLQSTTKSFLLPDSLRSNALAEYGKLPIPVKKMEDWKYTDVSTIFDTDYSVITEPITIFENELRFDAYHILFVNGICISKVTDLPEQMSIVDFSEQTINVFADKIANTDTKFSAINTAFAENGKIITVKKSAVIDKPVQILFLESSAFPAFLNVKNVIVVEDNAQVEFIERHISMGKNLTCSNIVTNVILKENAQLHYTYLQMSKGGNQINSMYVSQAQHSKFEAFTAQIEGGLVRNSLFVNHDAPDCETNLDGVFFPGLNQVFDNFTLVKHQFERGTTNENYRGVAKDNGEGIFVGKVFVARGAQKTNAKQSNKNIVLSNEAKIHSKPQLEIYADDVSCAHGSTTGQLDKDALFYCRARGIRKADAMKLLLNAFLADPIKTLKQEIIVEYITTSIENKLS